jgi:hypothetical protein
MLFKYSNSVDRGRKKITFKYVSNSNQSLESKDIQYVHLRSIEVDFSRINQNSKDYFWIHQFGVSPFDPITV